MLNVLFLRLMCGFRLAITTTRLSTLRTARSRWHIPIENDENFASRENRDGTMIQKFVSLCFQVQQLMSIVVSTIYTDDEVPVRDEWLADTKAEIRLPRNTVQVCNHVENAVSAALIH
jgi:hypothetical protein